MQKDKNSVVELMVTVYEMVNTKMALMSGMTEEETEAKTKKTKTTLKNDSNN